MKVWKVKRNDIPRLVELDNDAYGVHGANEKYFTEKLKKFRNGIFVCEQNKEITGFIAVYVLEEKEISNDFCELHLKEPIKGKWMHIIAFTTQTNYKDKKHDGALVAAAEKFARQKGCLASYVPLSKEHPFEKHGVFDFWKENGYRIAGKIQWV